MKEIIDKFIEEISKQDTEKLICHNPYISLDTNNSKYLIQFESNKCWKDIWNVLWISLEPTSLGISFREYVLAMNSPRNSRFNFFKYDNIERISNEDGGKIVTIEDVPRIVKWILTLGYSVWGNRWGYITKAGRKARGRLYQMGYRLEKSDNKKDLYLVKRE